MTEVHVCIFFVWGNTEILFVKNFMNFILFTGKNNRFPFSDILGYLKNTHKNPKFGRVRQVPTRELHWEFPLGNCVPLPKLGFLWVFFKYEQEVILKSI